LGQKIVFFLEQYSLLGLIFIAILGWGGVATAKILTASEAIPRLGKVVLQATTGLGLITIFFLFLASISALTAGPTLAIVIFGIVLFIPRFIATIRKHKPGVACIRIDQLGLITSVLIVLATVTFLSNALVRPLMLPLGWDEIAYHLPTAQAWAKSGKLLVTDWLRYPLFPFNMELLYAGTLVLANDITVHLVHALTGFLTVLLTFSIARIYMPVVFSALASVFLVYAIRQTLQTADIDLGLMLYIFSAFAALTFSYIVKQKNLTFLSAFFVGLALGTKYQAMFFLPALAIGFLMVERNWKILALAAVIAITTGLYWYVRNFLVSGDPIHPIGGSVFGYWLWNADDIRRQFLDLDGARRSPPWYLLPSIGSLIFWKSSAPVVKGSMVVSVAAVLVWLIVSGYDRYLMPIYPLLAIFSSYFIYRLFAYFHGYQIFAKYWSLMGEKIQLAVAILVLSAIILDWGKSTKNDINKLVLPGSVDQVALLRETYPGFELLNSLGGQLFGTVYQLGFEDEIYYLGTPVLGDHFGKARYQDVLKYVGNTAALADHLRSLDVDYLMVNVVRHPTLIQKATSDLRFFEYFELVSTTSRAVLYKLKETKGSSTPREMPFSVNAN
jgi:hypothetical protein